MKSVRMYTTGICPYCAMAKRLLQGKGVAAVQELRVDQDPSLREQMLSTTQRRTVPQIYIGDTHVGGFDDLATLDRTGRLDALLKD